MSDLKKTIKVTFDDGDYFITWLNASPEEIYQKYEVGSSLNMGAVRDEFKRITSVEILPYEPRPSPYERTRAAVEATGNKWARENFQATHD